MSSTRSVRTLAGVALASSVILLGGCASTGTTGASTGAQGNNTSSAASGGSSASSDTSGGSVGGLGDSGCQAALSDIASGGSAVTNAAADPKGAGTALTGIAGKLHADAGKSPKASSQITKLADDYASLGSALSTGKIPDTGSLLSDETAMTTACQG